MNFFDFHCDTPLTLTRAGASFGEVSLAVSSKTVKNYTRSVHFAACFTPPEVSDAAGICHARTLFKHFAKCVEKERDAALLCAGEDFARAYAANKILFIPAVEDLRILDGDLTDLDTLRALGVRAAAPLWRDFSIIGGAWNTDKGLSSFGFSVVERMLEIGIIPDISHASPASAKTIFALAARRGKPVIASHANAFAITPHRRNLDDETLRAVSDSGGVIGVNLYTPFLTLAPEATIDDLLAHVKHLFRVVGREAVVFGTDFDGMDAPVRGLLVPDDLIKLILPMKKSGFTDDDIDRLFYQNGYRFCTQYL